jgi:hypothetical protein
MEEIKYKVVYELGYQRLEEKVNKLMSQGYIPIGGICIFTHPNKDSKGNSIYVIACSQAMVKK